jgi:hypothetical protein
VGTVVNYFTYNIQAVHDKGIADETGRHQDRLIARGGTSRLAVSLARAG